jgi:D-alanine-D-alanine ligase
MKKLRVLALMHEDLVPPVDVSGVDIAHADWKMEYDVVTVLREMKHEVYALGVGRELTPIRTAVSEWKPDIVFNLLEGFDDEPTFDQNVVSYLELLRVPYTGCNPRGLLLARDKALSKQLLSFHRIPVPDFMVCPLGRKVRRPKRLTFPLIVKSLTMEASIGISQASVVEDDERLHERVRFVHEKLGTDAIVEQYIDGRELYVGTLGNRRVQVLPIWELLLKNLPEDARYIATERVKSSPELQQAWGVKTTEAKNLPEEIRDRVYSICKRAYRILWLSGYARFDLRLDKEQRLYVLEANPNPQLAYGEDFAEAAEHTGIAYGGLLQRILNLGLRWHADRGG